MEENNKSKLYKEKSNNQILLEVKGNSDLLRSIQVKKVKMTGHLFQHNPLLNTIFEGKVVRIKPEGKAMKLLFQNLVNNIKRELVFTFKKISNRQ